MHLVESWYLGYVDHWQRSLQVAHHSLDTTKGREGQEAGAIYCGVVPLH